MGYDFASLSFDLETQLKGQICHFVMKLTLKVKVKVKDQ